MKCTWCNSAVGNLPEWTDTNTEVLCTDCFEKFHRLFVGILSFNDALPTDRSFEMKFQTKDGVKTLAWANKVAA